MSDPLRIVWEHGERSAWRGGRNIAREGQGDAIAHVKYLLALADRDIRSGAVAHIGGGFCVMARIMGPAFDHTIYEIDPDLVQFRPVFAQWVPGDWRNTFIGGPYDVIVYDLGGPAPGDILEPHLKSGGILLPRQEP